MKIVTLSRGGTLYSCRRLRGTVQQRGHRVEILDPPSCYMNVSPAASSIHYKGHRLSYFDVVVPRIGSAITYYGTAVSRQFELLGGYPLNESVAIICARDKLHSLQLLARQGIDSPLIGTAYSPDDTSNLIAVVGGASLVVKLVEGTQGTDVVLAEIRQTVESVVDAFRGLNVRILVKEYTAKTRGCDIRYLVVGNEVMVMIERRTKESDLRSNLHHGDMATVVQISDEERAIAIKATQTLEFNVVNVDILRATRGPLVTEANVSLGLEGAGTTTGADIASRIIAWIECQATSKLCLKIGG